jgi:hypothetical protein
MIQRSWWEDRRFLAAIVFLSTVPLLWPETPPLVDVPGHIGRYRIELSLASSSSLQKYFLFNWAFIGNLGVDLLVIPLSHLFGLEGAVKWIVVMIPAFSTAGIFYISKEVHGKVIPSAFFAIPFIYNYPLNFGFINFALSAAIGLISFGLWLHLGRLARSTLRTLLFVPIGCLLWLIHTSGWGMLGLMAYSSEVIAERDRGKPWLSSFLQAGMNVASLAVPVGMTLLWRVGHTSGETAGFVPNLAKAYSVFAILRDRWLIWDSVGVAVGFVLIGASAFDRNLTSSRKLMFTSLILFLIFLVIPEKTFGSSYSDMRLMPFVIILALVSIKKSSVANEKVSCVLALIGVAFFGLRIAGNTASFFIEDKETRNHLVALNYIPSGETVLSLVGHDCMGQWKLQRYLHLGSFVIARKRGYSNDQWARPEAHLLQSKYAAAGAFAIDPSQFVYSKKCVNRTQLELKQGKLKLKSNETSVRSIDDALAEFPRTAFDYVWLISVPDLAVGSNLQGLDLVWRSEDSALYRIRNKKFSLRPGSDLSFLPAKSLRLSHPTAARLP